MTRVRLRAGPGAVARAIAAARAFAGEGEAADTLAIVTEEWVANVLEHGAPAPGSLIVLTFARAAGGMALSASDAGAPFDPRAAGPAEPNLERGGGAGLALILAWCDVDWRRTGGRNRVVLTLRDR
jgi:anti-sigma regulatory factor (Ser/Thr protein kinase)